MVEVAEGVTHSARARWHTAEEFSRTLLTGGGCDRVFRYRWLDSVSPVEPLISHSGGQQCVPDYISWTEERVVCYNQSLLTANQLHQGYADVMIRQAFDSQFANFLLYCANDFGKVATAPITFVLE